MFYGHFPCLLELDRIHLMASYQNTQSNAVSLIKPVMQRSSLRTSLPSLPWSAPTSSAIYTVFILSISSLSCPPSSSTRAHTTSSFLYTLCHQYIHCPASVSILHKIVYPSVSHCTSISLYRYSFQLDQVNSVTFICTVISLYRILHLNNIVLQYYIKY